MFKVLFGTIGFLVGLPAGLVLSFVVADWLQINWFHGGSLPLWPVLLSVAAGTSVGICLGGLVDAWRLRRRR